MHCNHLNLLMLLQTRPKIIGGSLLKDACVDKTPTRRNLIDLSGSHAAAKVKGTKGRTLGIAPQVRQAYTSEALRYMHARTKQRRTYLPLNLP